MNQTSTSKFRRLKTRFSKTYLFSMPNKTVKICWWPNCVLMVTFSPKSRWNRIFFRIIWGKPYIKISNAKGLIINEGIILISRIISILCYLNGIHTSLIDCCRSAFVIFFCGIVLPHWDKFGQSLNVLWFWSGPQQNL